MNITDPISARAGDMPDAPAILTAKATLSYAELDCAVSSAASAFAKDGLSAGDFVAIHLADQVQHVITSLALARLGAGQIAFDNTDAQQLQLAIAQKLNLAATVAGPASKTRAGVRTIAPPRATCLN